MVDAGNDYIGAIQIYFTGTSMTLAVPASQGVVFIEFNVPGARGVYPLGSWLRTQQFCPDGTTPAPDTLPDAAAANACMTSDGGFVPSILLNAEGSVTYSGASFGPCENESLCPDDCVGSFEMSDTANSFQATKTFAVSTVVHKQTCSESSQEQD